MTFLSSASLPWITALDLDLTTQGNQTLNTDTNFTIGGLTWTKINTSGDSSPMTLTNGSGLIITPTSAANLGTSTFSSPALRIPITSVIPSFTLNMPLRIWIFVSSDNAAANFDGVYWGTYVAGSGVTNQYTVCGYKGFATSSGWGSKLITLNSDTVFTSTAIPSSSNKVGVISYPLGVIGGTFPLSTGTTVSGGVWPAQSALILTNTLSSSGAISSSSSGNHTLTDLNFFITAIRNPGGAGFNATIARFRVDYLPTTS